MELLGAKFPWLPKMRTCFSFADNLSVCKNLSLREGVWGVDGCDDGVRYW
jgi:hypothetical protein